MKKVATDHVRFESAALYRRPWIELGGAAKILYWSLKGRYDGTNNGEIKLTYAEMKDFKGCSNHRSLSRAFKELEEKGWIKITQQGGVGRKGNRYELTFKHEKCK